MIDFLGVISGGWGLPAEVCPSGGAAEDQKAVHEHADGNWSGQSFGPGEEHKVSQMGERFRVWKVIKSIVKTNTNKWGCSLWPNKWHWPHTFTSVAGRPASAGCRRAEEDVWGAAGHPEHPHRHQTRAAVPEENQHTAAKQRHWRRAGKPQGIWCWSEHVL